MSGPSSSSPATSPFVPPHLNVEHLPSLNTTFIAYNNSSALSLEGRPAINAFSSIPSVQTIGSVNDFSGNNLPSLSDLPLSDHDVMGLDLDSAAQLLNALPLPDVDPTDFLEAPTQQIDTHPSAPVFMPSPTITPQSLPAYQISLSNSPRPSVQPVFVRTFVSPSPLINPHTSTAHLSFTSQHSSPQSTQQFTNTEQDERQEVQRIKEQLLSGFPAQFLRSPASPSPAQFQQPYLVPPTQNIAQLPSTPSESRPTPPLTPKAPSPMPTVRIPSSVAQSAENGFASALPQPPPPAINQPQATDELSTNNVSNSAQAGAASVASATNAAESSVCSSPCTSSPAPITCASSTGSECSTPSASSNSNPGEVRVVSTGLKLRIKLGPRPELGSSSPAMHQRQLVASSPLVSATSPGSTSSANASPSNGDSPSTSTQALPPVAFYSSPEAQAVAASVADVSATPQAQMQTQSQTPTTTAAPKKQKRRMQREATEAKSASAPKKRARSSLSDSESVSSEKELATRTERESAELAALYAAESVDVTQRLVLRRPPVALAGADSSLLTVGASGAAVASGGVRKQEPSEGEEQQQQPQQKPRKVVAGEITREQRRERRHAQSLLFQVSQQAYSNEALLESFDSRLTWLIHNSCAAANAASLSQFTLRSLLLGALITSSVTRFTRTLQLHWH